MQAGSRALRRRDFETAERAFSAASAAWPDDYEALVALAVARRARAVEWPATGARAVDLAALREVEGLLKRAMDIDPARHEAYLDHGLLVFHLGRAMGRSHEERRTLVLQRMREARERAASTAGCAIPRGLTRRYVQAVMGGGDDHRLFVPQPTGPGARAAEAAAEPEELVREANRKRDAWLAQLPPIHVRIQAVSHDGAVAWANARVKEVTAIAVDYDSARRAGYLPAAVEAGRMGIRLYEAWAARSRYRLVGPMGSSDPNRAYGEAQEESAAVAAEAIRLARRCVAETRGTEHAVTAAACEAFLSDVDSSFVPLDEVWPGIHPEQRFYGELVPSCPTKVLGGPVCDACDRGRELVAELRRCRRGEHASLTGTVHLRARLDARGFVTEVTAGNGGGRLDPAVPCMTAVLREVSFAPPVGGEAVVLLPVTWLD